MDDAAAGAETLDCGFWGGLEHAQHARPARLTELSEVPTLTGLEAGRELRAVLAEAVDRIRAGIRAMREEQAGLFDPLFHGKEARAFPRCVEREHVEYVVAQRKRKAAKARREKELRDEQLLALRVEDKVAYAFDRRSPLARGSAGAEMPYERKWLSVLNQNEEDKERADFAVRLHKEGSRFLPAAKEKLDWVRQRRRKQEIRLQRLEHVLHIVQLEQKKDIAREKVLFQVNSQARQARHEALRVAKERTETADMVMRLLQDYKLVSNVEMSQYLLSANENYEQQLRDAGYGDSIVDGLLSGFSGSTSQSKARPKTTAGAYGASRRQRRALASRAAATADTAVSRRTVGPRPLPVPLVSQRSALAALRRRELESAASQAAVVGGKPSTAAARAGRGARRRRPRTSHAPEHWGGWGNPMSFQAERILVSRGHLVQSERPPSMQADELVGGRIDKLDATRQVYSHLFKRGIHVD